MSRCCAAACIALFRPLPPPGLLPPPAAAWLRNPFRQAPPPTAQSARCFATACIACFTVSYASLHPPPAAFGFGTSLHPSIWLNRRADSLPLASLVSPVSFAPPLSATGGVGVTEPQAALRLRSPGPSESQIFRGFSAFLNEYVETNTYA